MLRTPRFALRTRLVLGYSVFFTVVLALLCLLIFLVVRFLLLRDIETELRTSTDLIQQDFAARNTDLFTYFNDPSFLLRTRERRIEGLESRILFVQVVTPGGALAATSASIQDQQLPLPEDIRAAAVTGAQRLITVTVGNGQAYMLVSPLRIDATIVGLLQVAQPLREVTSSLELLAASLVVTGIVGFLLALRGGTWLASHALRPVVEIARIADGIIRAEDLAQRVPAVATNDEIGTLTTTINAMLLRLEQVFDTQQHFLANVSHELRTPLTAMRGNVEILRRGAVDNPQALRESLADIEREVGRLVQLTNDLLALAHAESGVPLGHEALVLDDLVLEVVRDLRPLADGVALRPRIEEQVAITGDRDRMKQALINLVANALQHTPAGGHVEVELARDQDCALLRVRDNGVGIAEADLPHVFERFYRADRSRTRQAGGAGLGLSIVQWIVEAHGGQVSVESTLGAGSVFTIALPLPRE